MLHYPHAPALVILGTPRGNNLTTRAELADWDAAGIQSVGDLYRVGTRLPYGTLVEADALPLGQFLLHASLIGALSHIHNELPTHLTIQYLHILGQGKHLIRWLVVSMRTHTALSLVQLRSKWEADLGHPYTDKGWDAMLEAPVTVTQNA